MKKKNLNSAITSLQQLTTAIQKTNEYFLNKVQRQVNASLTLRNWIIGHYIFEYEQQGEDRAKYGEQLYKKLSENLKRKGVNGLSFTNLHLFK